MQRQLQPAPQLLGRGDGARELGRVARIGKPQVGAQMVEAQRAQEIDFARRQIAAVARHTESDGWQTCRGSAPDLDSDRAVIGDGRGGASGLDRHLLPDALPGTDGVEAAAAWRVRLRLEGGVGPVALILELEGVALEIEADGDIVGEVGGEALDRREDGDFGLVGDELRGHLGREGIGDLPIGGDAAARSADVIPHAVVDVEADQLVGHVGAGGGVHRVADRAVGLAPDLAPARPNRCRAGGG